MWDRAAANRFQSDPELLTTAQAAQQLGVSRRTLARYAERGQLAPTLVLPSGHLRWNLEDVRRQLRALRAPGDGA